jgi:hypothetical protein
MLLDAAEVVVVDAIDIVYTDNFEDVMDADVELHVGYITHLMYDALPVAHGHLEEVEVAGMFGGVAPVGEVTVESLEANVLSQLEFLEQRDADEDLA